MSPQVIQINLVQSLAGIAVILLGAGVAWGNLRASVKHINDGLKELKKEVQKLQGSIGTHSTEIVALQVHTKYGVAKSPIRPNDLGQKLLKDSGFNEQYPKIRDKVFRHIAKSEARTLYDYQTSAKNALDSLRSDPLIDPLKDYAVNHPNEPLELIFDVASWVIRDDYAKGQKR